MSRKFVLLSVAFGVVVLTLVEIGFRRTSGASCPASRCDCDCPAVQCEDHKNDPVRYDGKSRKKEVGAHESAVETDALEIETATSAPHDVNEAAHSSAQTGIMEAAKSATMGKTFSGNAVREFPGDKIKFASFVPPRKRQVPRSDRPQCDKWAVMTTIFPASEAVRRQVRLKDWCLVVVFDKREPHSYDTRWVRGEGSKAVVLLNVQDQVSMKNHFVDAVPWNNFGRKNIGYLYAIQHGAGVIWDFDDDNMLKFWLDGAAPTGAPSIDAAIPDTAKREVQALEPKGHTWPTYNPYPVLGAPTLPSWPRGLPPDDIKVAVCSNTSTVPVKVDPRSIAVLQSLAEYEPDVDAIFRITQPIPQWFKRSEETRPLLVPTGVLTPYNAQATLHFQPGFYALYLPFSVTGRVSDIWRSFFAQRLFWDSGLKFGFVSRPLVVQDRNVHTNLADFEAETDIYLRSKELVRFLGSWKGKGQSMVERTEELWIALYERMYIEMSDVELVQLWLQALLDTGYQFPEVKRHFDYDIPHYPVAVDKVERKKAVKSNRHRSLTFWTSDLHDGARLDMPSALVSFGHQVMLAGHKGTDTPYPDVFRRNGMNVYTHLSDVIQHRYLTHSTALTEKMVRDNFNFFKGDPKIAETDAFICSFPSSMCELWMPFNKTIILDTCHRYNLGRCTSDEFIRLNEHLRSLAAMDHPKNIIAAASVYDEEYIRHYTGLDTFPLHATALFYTNGHPYSPTKKEILFIGHWLDPNISEIKSFNVIDVRNLYPRWTLFDLVSHRAVVFIPYAVMTYKITEFYALSIPMFVPSIKYYRTVHPFGPDRSSLSSFYCKNMSLDADMKPHPTTKHPYSPNLEADQDPEAEFYWLQMADYYCWPHITYFDDAVDLERKLAEADFDKIHRLMVEENEEKKKRLEETWSEVVDKIEKGRKVPQDYDKAIRALYGTKRLQVN